MRIFVDTNVWVAASISHGLCAQLVRLLLHRMRLEQDDILISASVRREYIRIMTKKLGAPEAALHDMLMMFDALTPVEEAAYRLRKKIPDPDDVPILAAALAAKADVFVTGDKALLALKKVGNLPMVAPRTLYEQLRGLA